MGDIMQHLRPRNRKKQGEISISDLVCPVLLPAALFATSSNLRSLSNSLALSAWIVYILDYRSSERRGGFPWLSFLPAWLCIATTPHLTESRFKLYLTFWTVLLYRPLFNKLVSKFSKSFTFGESSILCQGVLLTFHSCVIRLQELESYRSMFLARQVAAWLKDFQHHCSTNTAITLLISWVVLSVLSVLVVVVYNMFNWRVTTATRKIFHLSVLLVYIPGLMYDPLLLYYCSIAATVVFIILELIRWSELVPILSNSLSLYLKHFTDEKEGGSLILTNIYLLIGVSTPLWLWPGTIQAPVSLALYAGIISVGIGDAASSLYGSKFGRVELFGTGKTLEGMMAGFLAQLAAILLIDNQFDVFNVNLTDPRVMLLSSACLLTSLMELMIDQVDNLFLPLIMFTSLVFVDQHAHYFAF